MFDVAHASNLAAGAKRAQIQHLEDEIRRLPQVAPSVRAMSERMDALQAAVSKLTQYEPVTKHYFHGGMYCREVYRDANVIVVGKVHKKEHFYVIVSGTVVITDGSDEAHEVTGPCVIKSMPGTRRAVTSLTPAVCMTFHRTDATTVEAAEAELVEDEPNSMYLPGNQVKRERIEVKP